MSFTFFQLNWLDCAITDVYRGINKGNLYKIIILDFLLYSLYSGRLWSYHNPTTQLRTIELT